MLCVVSHRIERLYCVVCFLKVQVRDVGICVFLILTSEWSLTGKKFIGQYAYSPLVDGAIIGFRIDKFRGYIVNCTTESGSSLINRVCGPAEIAQFDKHVI